MTSFMLPKWYWHKSNQRRVSFKKEKREQFFYATKWQVIKLKIIKYWLIHWWVAFLLSCFTSKRSVSRSALFPAPTSWWRHRSGRCSQAHLRDFQCPLTRFGSNSFIACPQQHLALLLSSSCPIGMLLSIVANSVNVLKACFCLYRGALCYEHFDLPVISVRPSSPTLQFMTRR